MAKLGVNVDHVATIRQARGTDEPDPVWAAALAQLGGADCITLHLREDRRHIQDRDLHILKETVTVKLNLEMWNSIPGVTPKAPAPKRSRNWPSSPTAAKRLAISDSSFTPVTA